MRLVAPAGALVLLGLALTACGGGSDGAVAPSSSPTATLTTAAPGQPLTEALARQALLTVDDLAGTYTASNSAAGQTSSQAGCLSATDVLQTVDADVNVRSAFVTAFPHGTSGVLSQVIADADAATTRQAFAGLRSSLAGCTRVDVETGQDTAVDLRVTTTSRVTDDAATDQLNVHATGTVTSGGGDPFAYDVRFAVSLVKGSLSVVAVYDLGKVTTAAVDRIDGLDQLVVDRLDAVS